MNKELEALKKIKKVCDSSEYETTYYNQDLKIIETALKEKQDKERLLIGKIAVMKKDNEKLVNLARVLAIIKEKKVEVNILIACDTAQSYNDMIFDDDRLLTQEQFEFLKEEML